MRSRLILSSLKPIDLKIQLRLIKDTGLNRTEMTMKSVGIMGAWYKGYYSCLSNRRWGFDIPLLSPMRVSYKGHYTWLPTKIWGFEFLYSLQMQLSFIGRTSDFLSEETGSLPVSCTKCFVSIVGYYWALVMLKLVFESRTKLLSLSLPSRWWQCLN